MSTAEPIAVESPQQRKRRLQQRLRELRTKLDICPSIQTDTTFLAGGDSFFSEAERAEAHRAAKAAGVTPSGRYISQLARFPHDPQAWVNSTADIKRICAQNGYSCEGAVKVKGRPTDLPGHLEEPYQVADDIVKEAADKEIGSNVVSAQERSDLEDRLRKRYSGEKQQES